MIKPVLVMVLSIACGGALAEQEQKSSDKNEAEDPGASLLDSNDEIPDVSYEEIRQFYVALEDDASGDHYGHRKWPLDWTFEGLAAKYDEVAAFLDTFHNDTDLNGNSFIEWGEMVDSHKALLELEDEVASPLHRIPEYRFTSYDINSDDKLDRQEMLDLLLAVHPWDDGGAEHVKKFDRSGDDLVNIEEVVHRYQAQHPGALLSGDMLLKKMIKRMIFHHDDNYDGHLNLHEIGPFLRRYGNTLDSWSYRRRVLSFR